MHSARRAYIYLACITSLESVAWAAISLLRNLLLAGAIASLESTAFQIAVIVIGLPIFVAHWLWAQRLARGDVEERGAVLRRLYLYGAMATFLGPFLANVLDLLDTLARLALTLRPDIYRYLGMSQVDVVVHNLVAMVVLALLWAYHRQVAVEDAETTPEEGGAATVRRLYVYGFSAAGLLITTLAAVSLLRWLLFQVGGGEIVESRAGVVREVARLAVGLPLWLIFWRWAERLFASGDEEEQASVLCKVYLYLAVFLGVLATVSTLTILLADGLGRVLGSSGSGGGDVRDALPVLIVAGTVWAYHAFVLRRDAATAGTPADAAWVERLYRYLVAGIGLGAFLVGVAGDISLLIRALAGVRFVTGLSDEAAQFTAVLIAGLPVWIVAWRQRQAKATAPGPEGDEESGSIIRKIYLYFYLLVATLTVLGSGVYIVFRLVGLALGVGQTGNLLAQMGQAIAFSIVAVLVWLYHASVLRADDRRAREAHAQRLSALCVTVIDGADGRLGRALLDALQSELPKVNWQPAGLTPEAAAALGASIAPADVPAALAASDLIVAPWTVAVAGEGEHGEIARAVAASRAHKVLLPVRARGWHWIGLDDLNTRETIRQAVRAVKQAAAGEEIKISRGLSAGSIVGIVLAAMVLFSIVVSLIGFFVEALY